MNEQSNLISQLPLGPDAAWRRYLDRIRRADDEGYERVEQEAWEELQAALDDAQQASPAGAA
ncbi:MAG: hypothetical protein QOF68_1042 [Gaiellales bacterium]|jgi:hypothetical protein|nr:hypothetical protein [Gaiellales bacterium]